MVILVYLMLILSLLILFSSALILASNFAQAGALVSYAARPHFYNFTISNTTASPTIADHNCIYCQAAIYAAGHYQA